MVESNNAIINFILEGHENKEEALKLVKTDFDKILYNYFSREKKFENVDFSVNREFEKLLDKYVPGSGKAKTVFGEIIRGYNKLMYRLLNDGDEIECGTYSGIIYGMVNYLDVPFVPEDNCCKWKDYEYGQLSNYFGCVDRDVITNICLNCLILETFDYYINKSNYTDIGNYYDNIVNFIVDEKIIDAFKKHDIDITNNMGSYGSNFYSDVEYINSISEDLYIWFNYKTIRIEYFANMNAKFKIEFDRNEIDTILNMYEDILKFIVRSATYDYKKHKNMEELKKELGEIGYTINEEKYIVKINKENNVA